MVIYEVFRLVEKTPRFLDQHLTRLNNSLKRLNISFSQWAELISQIKHFVEQEAKENDKIWIGITVSDQKIVDIELRSLGNTYPAPQLYQTGVRVAIMEGNRLNPEVKTIQAELKEKANQLIKKQGVFEVLLLNESNEITEGSRSNVFFVKNKQLISSPANTLLPGITWQILHTICKERNIDLVEKAITQTDILSMEAAFLTGTSPKILPISEVDAIRYPVNHPLTDLLIDDFNNYIHQDISLFSWDKLVSGFVTKDSLTS